MVTISSAAELAAMEQAPGDQARTVALAEALIARADADGGFTEALGAWWARASQVQLTGAKVSNRVSGSVEYGPVLQGRDLTDLTFGARLAMPTPDPGKDRGPS